ncbi:hypothetical protein GIB67_031149 [Kingdonia uniflora]|uniref:Thioesterase domain-containing protein n=1 Tax=Kingdonia uniflora TaxID=39325 RepID=A0A7J7NK82_9MAGN|nr:hypothetical protein GIB67_031149 [Kingdonia uniflora]
MAKPSNNDDARWISKTKSFLKTERTFVPEASFENYPLSDLIRGLLKVDRFERGRITCLLTVKQPATNIFGSLHGGAVATIAEFVAVACAKSVVVNDDRELFLGELTLSYLSAAFINTELEVEGCIVRHGRNVTVISVEFRIKENKKLVYNARATFYKIPVAKL